jgi:hypothetical protein
MLHLEPPVSMSLYLYEIRLEVAEQKFIFLQLTVETPNSVQAWFPMVHAEILWIANVAAGDVTPTLDSCAMPERAMNASSDSKRAARIYSTKRKRIVYRFAESHRHAK